MTEIYQKAQLAIANSSYRKVGAKKAFKNSIGKENFVIKFYENLGGIHQRVDLRQDLIKFVDDYLQTRSLFKTFWAIFKDRERMDEDLFERRLWDELSSLTSEQTWERDRDPRFHPNHEGKEFYISLGGKALSVVGLHPHSHRPSRRFPWPTLVFNVYEQLHQKTISSRYISNL